MNTELEVLNDIIYHKMEVAENLEQIKSDISKRQWHHDNTKFTAEEFDAFVYTRPKFKKVNYGSKEYQECVDAIKPAVEHHHKSNRHHTGYYDDGVMGMTLMDILEMLADWKAASRRSPDLSFEDSLPKAYEKYNIPKDLQKIINNTLIYLGWTKEVR